MSHLFWCFILPCDGEELRLPLLAAGVSLLPQLIDVVIQQHPQSAHLVAHQAVVKGQAEAAGPSGPVIKK